MTALYTEADLAEMFRATPRMVADWRREFDWPCVVFKRRIRFTQDHIDQILARHEQRPDPRVVAISSGQTTRSARRSSRT